MAANTWSASARLNLVTATLRRFGTLTRHILLRLFQTDVVSSAEGGASCLDGAELRGRDRAWRPGDFARADANADPCLALLASRGDGGGIVPSGARWVKECALATVR